MKTYLNEWMDHFELSVEELGEKSGISPKVITKWLNGISTPSLAAISQISETLGITIDDIVYHTPDQLKTENVDESLEPDAVELSNVHLIETTSSKEATHIQNFFDKKEINYDVITSKVNGVTIYFIEYDLSCPFDIAVLHRVAKSWRYKKRRKNK